MSKNELDKDAFSNLKSVTICNVLEGRYKGQDVWCTFSRGPDRDSTYKLREEFHAALLSSDVMANVPVCEKWFKGNDNTFGTAERIEYRMNGESILESRYEELTALVPLVSPCP